MDRDTFTIVFERLDEATHEPESPDPETLAAEIDEIAELRRMVLEIIEPEPLSYTTA